MVQDAAKRFELVEQGYSKLLAPEHPEIIDASDRLRRCKKFGIDGDHDDGDVGSNGGDGNDGSGNSDG